MSSSIPRPIVFLAGAAIVVGSFFITLKVLDDWGTPGQSATSPIQEPAYKAETLPHLKVGQSIDYTSGHTDTGLLAGWSGPETGGVWSDGHAAFIGFIVDGIAAPKQVILHTGIFLAGTLTEQHVQVWSGDRKLAEYDLKAGPPELTIPLGGLNVSDGTPVILGFYLPDAVTLKKINPASPDPRALGLRLYSLQLAQ